MQTSVHKKDENTKKSNYRPISVLPVVAKRIEKILHKQISHYIAQHLSKFLCGCRKGCSAQQALIIKLGKWHTSLDNKGLSGAILMGLSKAFDTLNHELFIAKLYAYGFTIKALDLIYSYLIQRWLRSKINTSFSTWTELLSGAPQSSVLGPLLFNIYINYLLFFVENTDVCNYADDTALHTCDLSLSPLMHPLEKDAKIAVDWFAYNDMKLNPDKCHILTSGFKHKVMIANIENALVIEDQKVRLFGIDIDTNLSFSGHIESICKKAGKKLNALSRQCTILPLNKRKILMSAFFISQFSYCPLVWMFCSRGLNNKINSLHYRSLQIVYRDFISTFQQLLEKDGAVTIHHRNIRLLATEMYKVSNGVASASISEIFGYKKGTVDNVSSIVD